LVAAELALAIVLLTGAGLMLKSFWRMNARPPGFKPEDILVMRGSFSGAQYAAWAPKAAYIQQLLQRMEPGPGVEAAGIDCSSLASSVKVQGAEATSASIRAVSAGYLQAMGAPLLQGRWPANGDLFGVLVNESFARKIAATGDPIG